MNRRVFIRTFGCQMNVADSARVAAMLQSIGCFPVETVDDADIVVVNTCSVRRHAEDRAASFIGELRRWKSERPERLIMVIGCYAQVGAREIRTTFPFVDAILGPQHYGDLAPKLEELLHARMPATGRSTAQVGVSVFLPVMHGCNNICSYCIVPHARGPERSVPARQVIAEASELLERGARELVLLGQNVNAYRDESEGVVRGFADLLAAIASLGDGKHRVRFMTSHPRDLTDRMIDTIAAFSAICPHVHLPVQSGSDDILMRMNRGYTADGYRERVWRIRERIPDVALTTDLIVGFPGETVADFDRTLTLVKELRFDAAFVFKYSPRPGTAAAEMTDDVSAEEKERRHQLLLETCLELAAETARPLIGRVQEVLVERTADGVVVGKTRGNRTVTAEASFPVRIGDIVAVRIEEVRNHTLRGIALSGAPNAGARG